MNNCQSKQRYDRPPPPPETQKKLDLCEEEAADLVCYSLCRLSLYKHLPKKKITLKMKKLCLISLMVSKGYTYQYF